MIAVLWEVAFSFAVNRAFGSPPVHPPFVMAKLVSILGKPAVSKVCASNAFVVCRFQDRLPIDNASFVWSEDEHTGVFNVVDVQTKRLLSDEQARFALAIIPPNLGHFARGVFLDALRQLVTIDLSEFYIPSLVFFRDRLPPDHFDRMTSSLAARSHAYVVFGRTVLYVTTILAALITALLLGGLLPPRTLQSANEMDQLKIWRTATYILLTGIMLNALICGGFSAVNSRYQARVTWLIQLSLITGICVIKPHWKIASSWKQESHTLSKLPAGKVEISN